MFTKLIRVAVEYSGENLRECGRDHEDLAEGGELELGLGGNWGLVG